MHFQGEYYFDKCLPFGCSISCSVFEKFSTFLQLHILRQLPNRQLMHYLDDFLTGGRHGSGECEQNLGTCLMALSDFGVPIAHEKTLGPATCLTFLGLEIDTGNMQVRIPTGTLGERVLAGRLGTGRSDEGHDTPGAVSYRTSGTALG
ncbi:uncharacterized protein LOC124255010 [Haliotis rubra]|uniref:uncharacterized protein LOC124255010 n=1 Tax=Haliotis rubra TaxID=36100 RepID=UPI001EE62942|nr:uncharacterized protein LOC124255010 [Haliotis rubra]